MKSLLTTRQRLILLLGAGLLAGALVWGGRTLGWLQPAELWQYDVTTSALAAQEPLADVTLVALTDTDLARTGWPVSDTDLARLAQATLDAGARAVGIDLFRDLPVGNGRDRLTDVLRDPRVVVISRLPDQGAPAIGAPPGAQTGFADVPIDPDGVARRALVLVNTDTGVELSFPLQLALLFTEQSGLRAAPENNRYLAFGPTTVPPIEPDTGPYAQIDAAGYQIMTQFRNAPPLVRTIPPDTVLSGAARIKDQVVIIGMTSDTVKDYFSTPLNRRTGADFTFGAEVHAAITQQLIDYTAGRLDPFRTAGHLANALLIFATGLLGATCAVLWPVRVTGLLASLGGAFGLFVGLSVVQLHSLLLPVVPMALSWMLGFAGAFAVIATTARQHRRIMVDLFASQLSEDLSSEIWDQRARLLEGRKLVSRRLFVTVLLADIEGSTRIGRQLEADAFMTWVSTLLDHLARVAQEHGGFVEKFTGDGILVVFGAPLPGTTKAAHRRAAGHALSCARSMQALTHDLNSESNGPDYGLRIGLNSGEVIAGTLGVPGAMRYNIIGDTVNIAARVEALIKTLERDSSGARPIAMTAATAALIDPSEHKPADATLRHDDGQTEIKIHRARQQVSDHGA